MLQSLWVFCKYFLLAESIFVSRIRAIPGFFCLLQSNALLACCGDGKLPRVTVNDNMTYQSHFQAAFSAQTKLFRVIVYYN